MLKLTCLPAKIYETLYPYKSHFRCKQTRHFVLFCWLLVALCLDRGKGRVKELSDLMPDRVKYWALLRLLRSGYWNEQELIEGFSTDLLRMLPAPADGRLHLIGDKCLKDKRGKLHPFGHQTKSSKYAKAEFGFEFVLMIASWEKFRVPVGLRLIDPDIKGHQNILFREMVAEFKLPAWVKQLVVEADAGFAANETFKMLDEKRYFYVFAVARTRKFEDGKYLSDFVKHLPRKVYRRVKSVKADGRRRDYWIYKCRKQIHNLGEVTIILSKKRLNDGPKKVKIIVTNLADATAGEILSYYARRWGIEVTFKELKSELHLGQMQVTKEKQRVQRAVAISVLAYLMLMKLYAKEQEGTNIFRMKQRFLQDVFDSQQGRTEEKWRKKWEKLKIAA